MRDASELSERELEILRLVATGASNKEIAHRLSISANTVKVHLRNIFAKVGADSRTEAAMYAVRSGLVAAPQGEKAGSGYEPGGETSQPGMATVTAPNPSLPSTWIVVIVVAFLVTAVTLVYFISRELAKPDDITATALPPNVVRWSIHAPLPTARRGLALAAYEDQVYAIGGQDGESIINRVDRYDPAKDTWSAVASKPTAVTDVAAVVLMGRIYVPGGLQADGSLASVMEVYNPSLDVWETGASLPEAISGYALAAFEGKLYVFGGWNGTDYSDRVYAYDPAQDSWEEKTAMPTARGYAVAVVATGKIFVFGGNDGDTALNVNEVYQPAREASPDSAWSASIPLPEGRYAMGATSIADIIQIVGGIGEGQKTLYPIELFPQEHNWVKSEGLVINAPAHFGLVALGTRVYLVGGEVDGVPQDTNISYQAIYTVMMPVIP